MEHVRPGPVGVVGVPYLDPVVAGRASRRRGRNRDLSQALQPGERRGGALQLLDPEHHRVQWGRELAQIDGGRDHGAQGDQIGLAERRPGQQHTDDRQHQGDVDRGEQHGAQPQGAQPRGPDDVDDLLRRRRPFVFQSECLDRPGTARGVGDDLGQGRAGGGFVQIGQPGAAQVPAQRHPHSAQAQQSAHP
jgi:hypothetical protein